MIKSLLLLFCLCSCSQSFSQQIHFKTKASTSPYIYLDQDTVEIKVLKYYITKLQLWKQQQLVYTDQRGAFLIDGLSDATYYLAIKKPYDSLSFTLGIDSAIQRKGALGKDLDPTNGMYWAWQSGYINFKLEGNSSLCPTRNHEFQFHLGGYLFPFESMQLVTLNVVASKQIDIDVDVSELMHQIDLVKQNQVMSPSYEAKELSFKTISIFKVHQ